MRKSAILIVIVALVSCLTSAAALAESGAMGMGVKAGLSLATFRGSDADIGTVSPGYRTGLAVGGYVNFELASQLKLQPEIYYAMKGGKYSNGGETLTMKFDYLEIPVLVRFSPETSGKVTPVFFAGPTVGFKLSAKAKAETSAGTEETTVDNLKGTDIGLAFGAGLEVSEFTFDARYTLGLTKIDDGATASNVKNGAFMFLVGYAF